MQVKQIPDLIKQELMLVEETLQKRLDTNNPLIAKVSKHICNSGGKRMRPVMLLLCSKLCNYTGNKDIDYACIIEFIHVATLLHDDVIDGSETRRGNHSANAKWGNNVPILVGDYLFGMSNVMLVEAGIPKVLGIVSQAIMDVSEGEIIEDVKKSDPSITEEEYLEIIKKKTAALFCAACQTGAVLGEKGKKGESALYNYGLSLGIAFQMMDDVLDFVAEAQKLGKPLGNDLREGNLTIPIIRLLQQANTSERARIKQIIQKPQGSDEELTLILKLLENYKIVSTVISEARDHIEQAKQNLHMFDDSVYKEALLALADYVIERDY